jgi:hypothetical protein
MSIFCVHCNKRLILEDLVIKSYQALKSYVTCGDVLVEKSGRVHATIQANDLTVHGVVEGEVQARGRVEIAASGSLVGAVRAPALRVADGARLVGYCEIRPAPPADVVAAEPAPAAAAVDRRPPAVKANPARKPAPLPEAAPAEVEPAPSTVPETLEAEPQMPPAVTRKRAKTEPAPGEPVKSISTRKRRTTKTPPAS